MLAGRVQYKRISKKKEVIQMAEAIEKLPAETRWEIATKGLTGACTAMINALQGALSPDKFEEFQVGIWSQAGKGAKELADTLGLTIENPRDIDAVLALLAVTSMGPEFEFKTVEATEDRCVGRTTKCAWHERWKELGFKEDLCSSGHQGWGDGAVGSLNPNFTFSLTKNMIRGDQFCEWIIERNK
jgi:hypothetical protein